MVMTDVFSKLIQLVPTHYQKVSTVAKVLIRDWFYHFGVLIRVNADQRRNFKCISCFADFPQMKSQQLVFHYNATAPQCTSELMFVQESNLPVDFLLGHLQCPPQVECVIGWQSIGGGLM
ncbi:hypothetical protein NQD34_008107 [Periophthalmus magnuspinnatus]|nr:hypothetical protein NQD34_008107 [Periophthalmus magnuspinnatus]